jgi:hypothetical protein
LNARSIIEAETPKKAFRRLPRQSQRMKVGEEVISGTSITRDIMEATLSKLHALDPAKYDETLTTEVAGYLNNDEMQDADFDPDYFLMEVLFAIMDDYVPAFTYFGFYEADGSVGCWPWDDMSLEDFADRHPDKLTIQADRDQPDYTDAHSQHIITMTPTGHKQCWHVPTRTQVWAW